MSDQSSIVHFELTVKVTDKSQLDTLIAHLRERDFAFNYYMLSRHDGNVKCDTYVVQIEDQPWANNLVKIGKILEKCDYKI